MCLDVMMRVIRKVLLLRLDCKELYFENIPAMEIKIKLLESVLFSKGLANVYA